MKKYLIFIVALFIPLIVTVHAASEYDSDEKIAWGVIGTAGTGATYEISPSKIFSSDANFGQGLYEFIYMRTKHAGSDLAVKRLLGGKPLSKEELFLMIPGSNIGELLTKKNPNDQIDQAEVEKKRLVMLAKLADEKELADLEELSKLEVEPTELFSDGDESNSGFDLIVDLDIIETILFGKMETVSGGAGPGAPAGSEVVDLGAIGEGEEAEKEKAAGPPPAGKVAEKPLEPESGGPGAGEKPQLVEIPTDTNVICPLNQSFNGAIEEIRDKEKAGMISGALGSEEGAAGGAETGTGAGGEAGAGGSAGAEGAGAEKPLTPAKSADWSRPPLCKGPFCLQIEKVYKKESSYLANENCIECHFEKINDAFKKTLSHNLVPSKATGNLMEGPKCKRSMFNLKQNFILIPQPILTPPNDDLIPKGDFIKNMIDFWEKYYDNPGRCDAKEGTGGSCKPDPDPMEEVTRNVLNQLPPNAEQKQAMLEIKQQVAAKKEEAAGLMEKARLKNEAESQSSQFQVLMQELDAMNSYFEGFMNLYNQLTSGKADSPCKALKGKSQCSAL